MGDELAYRPIKITQIAPAKQHRLYSLLAHLFGLEIDLQHQINTVSGMTGRCQIWQRLRISAGTFAGRNTIWFECGKRNNPGRNRSSEALREEWTERLILPCLNIPCRPIVDQT